MSAQSYIAGLGGIVIIGSATALGYRYLERIEQDSVRLGKALMPVAIKLASNSGHATQFVNFKLCKSESELDRILLISGRSMHPVPVLVPMMVDSTSEFKNISNVSENFRKPCYLSLNAAFQSLHKCVTASKLNTVVLLEPGMDASIENKYDDVVHWIDYATKLNVNAKKVYFVPIVTYHSKNSYSPSNMIQRRTFHSTVPVHTAAAKNPPASVIGMEIDLNGIILNAIEDNVKAYLNKKIVHSTVEILENNQLSIVPLPPAVSNDLSPNKLNATSTHLSKREVLKSHKELLAPLPVVFQPTMDLPVPPVLTVERPPSSTIVKVKKLITNLTPTPPPPRYITYNVNAKHLMQCPNEVSLENEEEVLRTVVNYIDLQNKEIKQAYMEQEALSKVVVEEEVDESNVVLQAIDSFGYGIVALVNYGLNLMEYTFDLGVYYGIFMHDSILVPLCFYAAGSAHRHIDYYFPESTQDIQANILYVTDTAVDYIHGNITYVHDECGQFVETIISNLYAKGNAIHNDLKQLWFDASDTIRDIQLWMVPPVVLPVPPHTCVLVDICVDEKYENNNLQVVKDSLRNTFADPEEYCVISSTDHNLSTLDSLVVNDASSPHNIIVILKDRSDTNTYLAMNKYINYYQDKYDGNLNMHLIVLCDNSLKQSIFEGFMINTVSGLESIRRGKQDVKVGGDKPNQRTESRVEGMLTASVVSLYDMEEQFLRTIRGKIKTAIAQQSKPDLDMDVFIQNIANELNASHPVQTN